MTSVSLGEALEDALQALEGELLPHDVPHLRVHLEVMRLLRIHLLRHFSPDHPTGDHRATPSVHVNPHDVHPLQLAHAGAPSLSLTDSGLREV